MTLRVAAAAAALVLAGCGSSARTGPPQDLTNAGRTLWEFEALLHDTFRYRHVSAHALNFACSDRVGCAPLSYWTPYSFVFSDARNSSFHLSSARVLPSFGVHPLPVKIKGRYVACNRRETRFVIT